MNGFLNLLKPPGMTSSDAVVRVRRTLPGREKIGHAGTLDPEAAGVLPLLIGKGTRLFDFITDKEKEYVAEAAFGAATDTQDAQGRVVARGEGMPDEAAIRAALPRLTGEIDQLPPAYSALKVHGTPAYALARRGQAAELAPRRVRVDALELLRMTPGGALLRVACGRGVYVRTLCADLGTILGVPSHMRFLLRTRSGAFTIQNAVTLEEWEASAAREGLLAPLDEPLRNLPAAAVPASDWTLCRNGGALTAFDAADPRVYEGERTRVYCGGAFAGLARFREGALRFDAMLME